jgi:hypothetical protein
MTIQTGGLDDRSLFSHSSGGWKPICRVPHQAWFGETALFLFVHSSLLSVSSHGLSSVSVNGERKKKSEKERERERSGVFFGSTGV